MLKTLKCCYDVFRMIKWFSWWNIWNARLD